MRTPFRYGNRLFSLAGQLLIFPALKDFICNAFSYGWDRNRAIDSKGNHNNALMGGYLLAASNTVISIAGILTTDTIKALTKDGFVGSVTVNGTISFSTGLKYGAFEVYRGTVLIGRYCLTERQGLQIINQITGGLPNGLLGGTTTTVRQRSNAFYSETNERGYSISGTGWVTSAGAALTVGTIVPADPANPTKCMAWISGVQQDLQFIGKARNSVSVVNTVHYFNNDRYYTCGTFGGTVNSYELTIYCSISPSSNNVSCLYATSTDGLSSDRSIYYTTSQSRIFGCFRGTFIYVTYTVSDYGTPMSIKLKYNGADGVISLDVINMQTGIIYTKISTGHPSSYTLSSATAFISSRNATDKLLFSVAGYIARITEKANDIYISDYVPDQYTPIMLNRADKEQLALNGISTNILQNVDLVHNIFNQTGYELWYSGTDYRIYPLSSTGTRIITPAGYTLVETVTAGNMPSVADSRMSTFKYALANSYAVRQSVPEAFDATDSCSPKLLTYSELSALSGNIKVTKTEENGKITNLTIRQ